MNRAYLSFLCILYLSFSLLLLGQTTDSVPKGTAKKDAPPKAEIKAKEETTTQPPEEKYRTPRAGKSLKGSLLGIDIEVPARERDKVTAVTLGAAIYTPKLADDSVIPFAAFYHTTTWEEKKRRIRMIIALLANYINFYDGTWNNSGFEVAASWENYTLPIPSSLVIEDQELKDSEIYWGYLRGGVGLGWRTRIPPYEIDSFFAIYVMYEPGYLYFKETGNTGPNYIVPSNTYEDRLHVTARVDAMERNIMELRHAGWAAGIDFIRGHRYKWQDHDFNSSFKKDTTETYYLLTGYGTYAGGPGFLSERHRFIFSVYGGLYLDKADLDRYSAFSLGGGPGGDEAEALSRSPIPGAKFDQFIVSRYLLFGLEYRFELLFFMYIHIKGVIGVIRRLELNKDKTEVELTKNEAAGGLGIALTTGFIWDSQLYVEYVRDWGVLRGKETTGDSILIVWSKSF
jgi:hypothetical protein